MDGLRRSYNSPESNAVDDTEIKLRATNVVIREEERGACDARKSWDNEARKC